MERWALRRRVPECVSLRWTSGQWLFQRVHTGSRCRAFHRLHGTTIADEQFFLPFLLLCSTAAFSIVFSSGRQITWDHGTLQMEQIGI